MPAEKKAKNIFTALRLSFLDRAKNIMLNINAGNDIIKFIAATIITVCNSKSIKV